MNKAWFWPTATLTVLWGLWAAANAGAAVTHYDEDGNVIKPVATQVSWATGTTVNQAEVLGTIPLNEVLTVLQYDSPDKLINPEFFEEKYAKNIGMVYKRSMSLIRVNLNPDTPWLGYDVIMTLSSYGG